MLDNASIIINSDIPELQKDKLTLGWPQKNPVISLQADIARTVQHLLICGSTKEAIINQTGWRLRLCLPVTAVGKKRARPVGVPR